MRAPASTTHRGPIEAVAAICASGATIAAGMHPRGRRRPQHLLDPGAQPRQGDGRLVHHEEELVGPGVARVIRRHQHQRRLGARDLGLVLRVAEKGKIAGAGGAERGNAADRGGGRAARGPGLHDGRNLVRSEGKLHDK